MKFHSEFHEQDCHRLCRLCSTADDSYRQVFSDLSRFRNARITQQDVLDAFRKSPHPKLTSLIHVHNGSVHVEGSNEEEAKVAYITSTIQKFAHELPNLSFVFYAGDIPLSWIAPLPADVEHEIQTGIVTAQEAWRRYGCEGVEHLRGINTSLHGVFQQLAGFRGLAPVFGAYHIEDCFAGRPTLSSALPADVHSLRVVLQTFWSLCHATYLSMSNRPWSCPAVLSMGHGTARYAS